MRKWVKARLKQGFKMKLKSPKMRKLDKLRRARETVPTGRIYRRHLVPPSKRPALLKLLGKKLSEPGFFKNLPILYQSTVKRFDFHFFSGKQQYIVPVAIKNTAFWEAPPASSDGRDYGELRKAFLAHNRAVYSGLIKPERYIMRSPKVYVRIGDFLVMEFVNSLGFNAYGPLKGVFDEIHGNFLFLKKKRLISESPQYVHIMPVANTNPADPKKGKWIVFSSYDYV